MDENAGQGDVPRDAAGNETGGMSEAQGVPEVPEVSEVAEASETPVVPRPAGEGDALPPTPSPAPGTSSHDDPPPRKTPEQRKAALAQAIQNEVVQGGRIESQSDFQAVFVFGKPVNHILHLLISLVTCGIWLLVWLGLLIFGGESRVMVSIDEYGNVLRQKIK